jgi:hypothetical protein
MIINQDDSLVVPDKTIAVFPVIPTGGGIPFDMNFNSFLKPLNKSHKRDWFGEHFYKCLPLAIGNMQGFILSIPFGFDVLWNGGNSPEDIKISRHENYNDFTGINAVDVSSDFGNGILTILFPITLKTPPGINLMTISPPNFPLPGLSPMTGVVESDNIRFSFTVNIKIDLPNTTIRVFENTPVAGILPIPRYFCDYFELKNAYDIFDISIVEEEMQVVSENTQSRIKQNKDRSGADKLYYKGMDVRGNKFKDHQLPNKRKIDK